MEEFGEWYADYTILFRKHVVFVSTNICRGLGFTFLPGL